MKTLVRYLVIQRAFLLKSRGPNQYETGERRESGYVRLGRPGCGGHECSSCSQGLSWQICFKTGAAWCLSLLQCLVLFFFFSSFFLSHFQLPRAKSRTGEAAIILYNLWPWAFVRLLVSLGWSKLRCFTGSAACVSASATRSQTHLPGQWQEGFIETCWTDGVTH